MDEKTYNTKQEYILAEIKPKLEELQQACEDREIAYVFLVEASEEWEDQHNILVLASPASDYANPLLQLTSSLMGDVIPVDDPKPEEMN